MEYIILQIETFFNNSFNTTLSISFHISGEISFGLASYEVKALDFAHCISPIQADSPQYRSDSYCLQGLNPVFFIKQTTHKKGANHGWVCR